MIFFITGLVLVRCCKLLRNCMCFVAQHASF